MATEISGSGRRTPSQRHPRQEDVEEESWRNALWCCGALLFTVGFWVTVVLVALHGRSL